MEPTLPGDADATPQGDEASALAREKVRAGLFGTEVRAVTLGRFTLLEPIGAGGMGEVFAAYDPQLDRRVAVKRLTTTKQAGSGQARLLREARAMARLTHPNVVTVYEAGVDNGTVYIAMEYLVGPTLLEWAREPRPWRDVVAMLARAGRGLHAAHQAGLVHRDFKPTNVMLDVHGEPKVLDFGLVRWTGDSSTSSDGDTEPVEDDQLSRTGAILGTPAYMAPEQYAGLPADARSDQFAFCIALHEALYGQRPFVGTSLVTLMQNVTEGRIVPEPSEREVPRRLRGAMLRGLSPDPNDRFSSMAELLAELDRVARPPRTSWAIAGLLGAALVGAVWLQSNNEPNPCASSRQQMSSVWNPERKNLLQRELARQPREHSGQTAELFVASVDAWSQDWIAGRLAVCDTDASDDRARGARSIRLDCFDAQLRRVDATLEALVPLPEGALDQAVRTAMRWGDSQSCEDPEWLRVAKPLPDEPQARSQVERVRLQIDRATALGWAARYEESLQVARDALAQAESSGFPPVEVEARIELGEAYSRLEDLDQAARLLEEAAYQARAVGHDVAEAWAVDRLLWALGVDQRKPEAESWARWAEAELQRIQASPEQTASLLTTIGIYRLYRHDHDRALDYLTRAVQIDRERADNRAYALGASLGNLALAHEEMGELEEAIALHEESLEVRIRNFGRHHPMVASARSNLTRALADAGRLAEAQKQAAEAVEERRRMGDDTVRYARALGTLANLEWQQGRYDECRAHMREALEIFETRLGKNHRHVGTSLNTLGAAAKAAEDYDEARRYYERALEVFRSPDVADRSSEAMVRRNLGSLAIEVEDYDEAIEHYEASRAIEHEIHGPSLARGSDTGMVLPWLHAQRGDRARARHLLEARAKEGRSEAETAWLDFVEAILAWHEGDRAGARERAEGALAVSEQHVDEHPDASARIQAWLDRHAVSP